MSMDSINYMRLKLAGAYRDCIIELSQADKITNGRGGRVEVPIELVLQSFYALNVTRYDSGVLVWGKRRWGEGERRERRWERVEEKMGVGYRG